MTGFFKTAVKPGLHVFPKGPAIRTHYHTTPHWGLISKLSLLDQLVVPLSKILRTGRKGIFTHNALQIIRCLVTSEFGDLVLFLITRLQDNQLLNAYKKIPPARSPEGYDCWFRAFHQPQETESALAIGC